MEPRTTTCQGCGALALAVDTYCGSCGGRIEPVREPYMRTWQAPPSPPADPVAANADQAGYIPLHFMTAQEPLRQDYIPLDFSTSRKAWRPGFVRRLGHVWHPWRLRASSSHR